MDSFNDVKSIAGYLGVNLGVNEPCELSTKGKIKNAQEVSTTSFIK